MPIGVANVDCQEHSDLCREQRVMAFPTLRWYENKEAQMPDYKSDRTVAALVGYAKRKLELNERFKDWDKKGDNKKEQYRQMYSMPENPGCQVSGTLWGEIIPALLYRKVLLLCFIRQQHLTHIFLSFFLVNRVPGNFHIEAKSKNHNLNAAMTNLTHRVNHLSFGEMGKDQTKSVKRALKQVPQALQQFTPLDGTMHVTREFHKAHHHYIKVVSTHLNMGMKSMPTLYQFLEQSQVVSYDEVNVPEARFSYDLSPMSVVVEKTGRKWYDYLTSLCAIIGGTFTTLGLIDAVLYKVFKPKKL